MEEHFLINPLTKRKIQRGGPAHRRLISKGIVPPIAVRNKVDKPAPTPVSAGAGATRKPDSELTWEEKRAIDVKDPEHPITAATPLASPEPLKPEPLKPAPSKPAPTPAPSKPESSEPEEGSESESSENAFYYDEAYKEYKEQLHEAQMEKLREVYAGLSNCELKMVIEMMSDAVVEKSKK